MIQKLVAIMMKHFATSLIHVLHANSKATARGVLTADVP